MEGRILDGNLQHAPRGYGGPRLERKPKGKAKDKVRNEEMAYPPMITFTLVVGGIGIVYDGESQSEAKRQFRLFMAESKTAGSRSSGESVTLFKNYEIIKEYSHY